jgi:hypothetical protein
VNGYIVLTVQQRLFLLLEQNSSQCNVIEEPRIIEEEKLPELGFELYVYKWQENKLEAFVKSQISSWDKVVSDAL